VGLPPVPGLTYEELERTRNPAGMPSQAELQRRANALGVYVTEPGRRRLFGLIAPRGAPGVAEPPVIESVRALRRIRPDNSISFDLVAEVTQRRKVNHRRWFYGGSTVIIGADGEVRYAIVKHTDSPRRRKTFADYLATVDAARRDLFEQDAPKPSMLLRKLHAEARR
jgi:hypothetical protein